MSTIQDGEEVDTLSDSDLYGLLDVGVQTPISDAHNPVSEHDGQAEVAWLDPGCIAAIPQGVPLRRKRNPVHCPPTAPAS